MSKKTIEERIEAGREYRRVSAIKVETRADEQDQYIVEG